MSSENHHLNDFPNYFGETFLVDPKIFLEKCILFFCVYKIFILFFSQITKYL